MRLRRSIVLFYGLSLAVTAFAAAHSPERVLLDTTAYALCGITIACITLFAATYIR